MSFPDWGNVPAWIGAGALLLAFRIFLRDRRTSDRAQVDSVGVWWEIRREISVPGGVRIDDVEVRTLIRNASDRPIEATQVAWTINTQWAVADLTQPQMPTGDPGVWILLNGKPDVMRFIGPVQIPPQKTWESQWLKTNLTHTAPEDHAWLDFLSEGARCVIRYGLITDNAGRRWETRHQRGKRARRIRWYSRSGSYYPAAWQNPIARRFRSLKVKAIGLITRRRQRIAPSVQPPEGKQDGSTRA
jgi:hypothetical protein